MRGPRLRLFIAGVEKCGTTSLGEWFILSLRNQFDRCFAVYSAYRTVAQRGAEAETLMRDNRFPDDMPDPTTYLFEHMFSIWMRHFPADQRDTVRSYVLDRRREFVAKLLGPEAIPPDLPPIERLNSSSALSIAAQKPDFDLPQWDTVRDYFREDLKEFEKLAAECGVSMEFVTTERLHRHLD